MKYRIFESENQDLDIKCMVSYSALLECESTKDNIKKCLDELLKEAFAFESLYWNRPTQIYGYVYDSIPKPDEINDWIGRVVVEHGSTTAEFNFNLENAKKPPLSED